MNIGYGEPTFIFDEASLVASSKGAQGAINALTFGLFEEQFDASWKGTGYSGIKCDPSFAFGNAAGKVSRAALLGALFSAGLSGGSSSVFWSGYEQGAMQAAQALGTTLEQTVIGRGMQYLAYEVGVPIPNLVWKAASAIFVANAEGTALAVIRAAGSTWALESRILAWRGITVMLVP